MQDTLPPPAAAFPDYPGNGTTAAERLLSRDEVAARLHVSRRTVRRLGQLDETFVTPQSPRITPESVERHLERNRVSAA